MTMSLALAYLKIGMTFDIFNLLVSCPPLNPIEEIGSRYPTNFYDGNRLQKMAQAGRCMMLTCWMVDVCDFGDQNTLSWGNFSEGSL